jgi:cell division septal protein FtsQ
LKERLSKIFSLLFFFTLTGGIFYLIITGTDSRPKDVYRSIEIVGCNFLSAKDYLRYAELNDTSSYSDLTLAEVKARLQKHPYIAKVEVKFDGVDKIISEVKEKSIKAVLLNRNRFKLITEEYEVLPLYSNASIAGLPVISNVRKLSKDSFNEEELQSAFKIIDALKLVDESNESLMYQNLAEINLRNGGDALLTFTGFSFPVVFGKGNEARKILSLSKIWNNVLNGKESFNNIGYIDLRYRNKIFIGKKESTEIAG